MTVASTVLAAPRWRPALAWETAVRAYTATLERPGTRHPYACALLDALRLCQTLDIAALSRGDLETYRAALLAQPGLSDATRRQRISAMRSFVTWARAQGWHSLEADDVEAALPLDGLTRPSRKRPRRLAVVPAPIELVTPDERTWRAAVEDFVATLAREKTRLAYRHDLRAVRWMVGQPLTLDTLTPDRLSAVRTAIMSEPVSVSTRRQRLAALRSFLRWADLMDRWTGRLDQSLYVLRLPAKAIGNPRGALTSEAAARLMRVARAKGDEALIAVMLGGGLRISEVAGLDVRDFRQEDQLAYLWIRDGKGGRSRAVPVLPDLAALVEGQVSGRRPDMPMFMTRRGRRGRLEVPGIRERVQRLAKVAGLPYLCPHMLRHTAGMRCLAIQGNVQAVSAILGHRDIRTTQGYLDHLHLADLAANLAPLPSDDEGNSAYPVTVTPLGDGFEVAPREEIDQGGMDQ